MRKAQAAIPFEALLTVIMGDKFVALEPRGILLGNNVSEWKMITQQSMALATNIKDLFIPTFGPRVTEDVTIIQMISILTWTTKNYRYTTLILMELIQVVSHNILMGHALPIDVDSL